MKKFYLTFCLLLAFSVSKAQYIFMDGTEGGAFLIQKYPGCFMPGNMFDTTCAAIVNEDTLILSNWNLEDNSLPYIHYFKNLKYLDISNNVLDHLPPLPSTLETFLCNNQDGSFNGYIGGSIINLPALPPGLKVLNCGSNRITNWPAVWPSTLEHLNISNNNLSSLPALPPGLKYLDCSNQQVVIEYISVNILPALDTILSLPPGLTHLICHSNSLTAVPTLPPTLKYLDCSNNRYLFNLCTTGQCVPTITYANGGIASLPNWPPQLEYLNVAQGSSYNVLGFYSFVLPQIIPASLIDLTADSISPQMILPPGLKYLSAGFETKCLPNLPASLGAQSPYRTTPVNLYLNSSSVNCIPNNVPGMRVSPVTIPYCNIQNNTNNCVADPSITGYVFYDLNSNGIWDPGEYPKQGVKVTNDNGIIGFSNINGQYAAQGHLGNNVTSITPPLYYNAVPASFNHTLNTADTLITDTVALQPNVSIDSMRITITPMNAARRGWDLPYHVKYENVGTTVVNANIVVNYNNALLTPTAGPLNLSLNNIGPGQRGEFTTTFYISTSAAFGAEVYTTATITAGTSTSTDESYLNVIFSFDPNDKHATPILTSAEVNAGEFIDYLVRFQNVGNDTAFNINITDQLSEHLIANTLEVIEASHACKTTQINDYLNFEFENILLPDSNVNEPASHGYIRFRVKPKTGLPINTDVPNNAAIYFDFNAPVIT
ncbi:MAG TPA: hypothetical protein PLC48_15005, partial [Ferruginibacter sp.]|nr:hypothetical protein [Ferruginibacter sp.]